jgi:ABC-2 type transport system ATP-binding protein
MTTSNPILRVSALTKRYGAQQVLRDVSFEVHPGEIVALVGPNGAGKTTALEIVAGSVLADRGSVTIGDHDLETASLDARRLLGHVPQKLAALPFLTGRELLELVAAIREIPESEVQSRLETLLDQLELGEARDRLSREYSEGMGRKLALAQGLIANPPLLLLDESLNGLDPEAVAVTRDLLRKRAKGGAAVVFTSHVLPLVEGLATRVLFLNGATLQRDVSRSELDALAETGTSLEDLYLEVLQSTPTPEQ